MWANAVPEAQALYDPAQEKDSCGVGFIVNIEGKSSHRILHDASFLLCNMTHRGAEGSHEKDGDGAGVLTAIPDALFRDIAFREYDVTLPPLGRYATGNVFLNPDTDGKEEAKAKFESIAASYNLKVLFWRPVPRDSSVIGPTALSKEPSIEQPFIVLDEESASNADIAPIDRFEKLLFIVRKHATNTVQLKPWFYACSLSSSTIIYKGQLMPGQVYSYFLDLKDSRYATHVALVHSRFSTNTFPSWDRAQPFRLCAHNGEINTLRGNKNWMRSREGVMNSRLLGSLVQLEKLYPIIEENGSDSSAFDNVLELLMTNGVLTLPEAMMVMVPEAWQSNPTMLPEKRAFYEWASCVIEPWDGPALMTFCDGRYVGACLDRNGLRPCRYYTTNDGRLICASEVGTLPIEPKTILSKGRLQPGKMLLVDTRKGCIVDDTDLKLSVSTQFPFGKWIESKMIRLADLKRFAEDRGSVRKPVLDGTTITDDPRMKAFGFTLESLNMLVLPMVRGGKEALGSMGTDTPLACLSKQPRCIYDYFKQLFAQVTNPPIDPIREEIVMSLGCYVGPEGNLLDVYADQCDRLHLPTPILTLDDLHSINQLRDYKQDWKVGRIDITYAKRESISGYLHQLDVICDRISTLIDHKYRIAILSDREVSADRVSVSTLVALGAIHHFLVKNKKRSKIALIVETAEAREVHHMCVLLGYGADAICPYLAIETILKLKRDKVLDNEFENSQLVANYKKALNNGILKVMSKMGISTLQSYKGAQIFEAVGIDTAVIQRCFDGTASRIKGVGFETLAQDAFAYHEIAYPSKPIVTVSHLPEDGQFHWRSGGESHINDPNAMGKLQDAVRTKNVAAYQQYSNQAYENIKNCTLRGLLDFRKDVKPVPIDEVEPWTEITKRFCTGAMSYGSISLESHSTLAVAMNRIGGKSNTGEGGEDPERSLPMANGDSMRSAIKQVASGRFGVTSYYLSDANEIQIKMAQGAKPGEGGELPGYKVSQDIAKTRKSTTGVGLISPPPHHDIYSIEDLKQLIYDLKSANQQARISVKLVSKVGVGVIAAGVAKAKADHILISGHDGGTGASRWTGIKHAGIPWELGLAETHQTLVLNDLRGRVVLQTDGQIKTGRDVAISCLLGAEEWGFATTPLIALGCIMMRKCHLNTCPVGIATQDPVLRKKFEGKPEHVINFFYYVAEEMREIMASLGFRTINEMVGRTDMLLVNDSLRHKKTQNIDLQPILTPAYTLRPNVATYNVSKQNHGLEERLDNKLIEIAQSAIDTKKPVMFEVPILNTDRAVGAMLSNVVSTKYGEEGLPTETIHIKFNGSAGQSFGAFVTRGITLELEGDCNDYVGKGLSGGTLVVYPPQESTFKSELNVIVGNVCLYGATSGEAYFRGVAAERFAVRNSGAIAVVEGVGDHGCEYMTGGRVIILGSTGRNFAAGMSGGIAYILDLKREFAGNCNLELVDLESVTDDSEMVYLQGLIRNHVQLTGSEVGQRVLDSWSSTVPCFVKVFPRDYKAALQKSLPQPVALTEFVLPNIVDIEEAALTGRAPVDKVQGFMKYKRRTDPYRDPAKRIHDFNEMNNRLSVKELKVQAARCMDCGVPFCQSDTGCPIGNVIPKWNELVYQEQWKEALNRLLLTNNFPEFTGRVCPAPCESACVLGITELPVSIKSIECAIIDRAFEQGWMTPNPPKYRSGKRIAIIGSGPAGLAAADQLNKAGHSVTVYDRNDRIGGLLVYGIPNMKLDKRIVQRRVDLMLAEGIKFITNAHIGADIDARSLKSDNDVLLLATGATWPRDLNIPNRSLNGIHFAMEFLQANTKSLLDSRLKDEKYLSANGRHVIVVGGGDTGCDCIGTSLRHGAASVVNFELLPQPPVTRAADNPWPQFARVQKVDYGHAEVSVAHGKDPRQYCILSKEFVSDGNGNVCGIKTVRVEWTKNDRGMWTMVEFPGSEELFKADLVLLAMGFLGPEQSLLKQLSLEADKRSNIVTPPGKYRTSVDGVYAAGDCRRGQSLIVWGINEGRQAAREIDEHLTGHTLLPVTGGAVRVGFETAVSKESLIKVR